MGREAYARIPIKGITIMNSRLSLIAVLVLLVGAGTAQAQSGCSGMTSGTGGSALTLENKIFWQNITTDANGGIADSLLSRFSYVSVAHKFRIAIYTAGGGAIVDSIQIQTATATGWYSGAAVEGATLAPSTMYALATWGELLPGDIGQYVTASTGDSVYQWNNQIFYDGIEEVYYPWPASLSSNTTYAGYKLMAGFCYTATPAGASTRRVKLLRECTR